MSKGRQPNGRPSIYLGADGWYHSYVTIGVKPDGKPNRKHVRAKTATEVGAKADELLAQRARGKVVIGRSETFGAWLEFWLEKIVKPRLAPKTYAGRRSIIRCHVIPAIGGYRMDGLRNRLEPDHVDAMYADLAKKLAVSYQIGIHRMCHKAMKDAVRRGRASRNVFDLVDPPTGRKRKVRAHSLDEAQQIITAAVEDEMAPRWIIGMLLGPRQGETLSLHWHGGEEVSRLDLDASPAKLYLAKQIQRRTWEHGCDDPVACVKVLRKCRTKPCPPRYEHGCVDEGRCKKLAHFCPERKQVPGCSRHQRPCPPLCPRDCTNHARWCPQRRGGGLLEVDLKTDESVRDLILPAALVSMLIAHRERQQRECAERGIEWDPNGLVFAGPKGQPLDPRRDHARWEQLLVRAGVPDSRLHTARHDAGTLALAAGIDIAVVQELLGHTSIITTRQYTDIADGLKKEAAEKVFAMLFDGGLAALLQPSVQPQKPQR